MRKGLFIITIIGVLLSCSTDEEKAAERNWKMFHFYIDKGNDLDVFEKVRFRLQDENREYFKSAAINPYDSVIWKLVGTNHSIRFTISNYGGAYAGGFEYLFTKTGKYKSITQWYHNRELIDADTFDIVVSEKKPFLGHDYNNDVTENIDDPFDSNVGYVFLYRKDKTEQKFRPSLVNIFQMGVGFKESPPNADYNYFAQQRRFLVNYFNHTYGQPSFSMENDDIVDVFYKYFNIDNERNQDLLIDSYESVHPEAIWISPTSYIALVRIHYTAEDWIIAQWDPNGYPYPIHDEYSIWAKER